MNDIILAEGFGQATGAMMSSNWKTDSIYLHFETTNPLESLYTSKVSGKQINFWDLLYYGLDHEEIHLVLHKIGEDNTCIDNEFFSRVMCAFWNDDPYLYQRKISYATPLTT